MTLTVLLLYSSLPSFTLRVPPLDWRLLVKDQIPKIAKVGEFLFLFQHLEFSMILPQGNDRGKKNPLPVKFILSPLIGPDIT